MRTNALLITLVAIGLIAGILVARAEDLTARLMRNFPSDATLVCGNLKMSKNADGTLHMEGPPGQYSFELKNDEFYLGGNRCVFMKCPKKEERQC
jgi:hypothetical protein